MASFSKTILLGNLGADPELRRTQSGMAVTELRVATTHRDKGGQEHTEWNSVVVWDKAAENCCKYLKKGGAVLVEGRLQTRSWEDKGQKKYKTEIVANNVQFLGGPKGMVTEKTEAPADMDIPF